MAAEAMELLVRRIVNVTRMIKSFELVSPAGGPLPQFEAGAHIEVMTCGDLPRAYSLSNDPAERERYLISVLHEPAKTAGSQWMHDFVAEGDLLCVRGPQNGFPLHEDAEDSLLVGGGIGITPIFSMARRMRAVGRPFRILYTARGPQPLPFAEELVREFGGRVKLHASDGTPAGRLDIGRAVGHYASGRHVYLCGPRAMLEAARAATLDWPVDSVHYELFVNRPAPRRDPRPREAFEIELARSGRVLTVPAESTLLETLREHGIRIPSACSSGICGTCKVGLLGGEADHRDEVLSAEERKNRIQTCCSRAKPGQRLIIDR